MAEPKNKLGIALATLGRMSILGGGLLLACSNNKPLDSSKVDPKAIWGDYRAESDESSGETKLLVSLRFRSESGTPIKLAEPSRITLEQDSLRFTADKKPDFKFEDSNYVMRLVPDRSTPAVPPPAAQNEIALIWIQKDGTEFRNVVPLAHVPRIATTGVPVAASRRTGLQVRFESATNPDTIQRSNTRLTCLLVSKAPADASGALPTAPAPTEPPQSNQPGQPSPSPAPAPLREQSVFAEWSSGCFFSATDLNNFALGSAELKVIGVRSGGLLMGHPAGGRVTATMKGVGLGFQINE